MSGGGMLVGSVSQVLCFDHSLLLICSSWSCIWFLGRRCGLLSPCALEMYSEASIVVAFPCGSRILAEFGMVAFALCSATSFVVLKIYFLHRAGCKNLHSSPIMPCRQAFFL